MEQQSKAGFAIVGSIFAIIGFYTTWVTASISADGASASVSVNGPEIARLAGLGSSSNATLIWSILGCYILILLIGLATQAGSNVLAAVIQKFLHLGAVGGFLWSFFISISNGSFKQAVQLGVLSAVGNNSAGYDLASSVKVNFGIGFWLMALGLGLSAIGVYAPVEDKQSGLKTA